MFGFFVLPVMTRNFGFFLGDISDPEVHNSWELFSALVVALITTILKFGDSTQIGAIQLATSSVALLQLRRGGGDVGGLPRCRPTAWTGHATGWPAWCRRPAGHCWPTRRP